MDVKGSKHRGDIFQTAAEARQWPRFYKWRIDEFLGTAQNFKLTAVQKSWSNINGAITTTRIRGGTKRRFEPL